jgi:chromosome segregation ATPase
MADNKTTYTGVIDVETKGTDSLAKLNKSLNETIDGFEDIGATIEKTRKALQKAKLDGDKVEFKRLRKELNQLETTFEDTEIQSRRFTDALSQQPGIVGLVGGSLKGLDGGMKVLAANPIIAVVTLLAGLFMH